MSPSIPPLSLKRSAEHIERSQRRTRMAVSDERSIALEKNIAMDVETPYLPKEIIANIFKRLPVKSLIRFQCVCKDWKNLIKTPSFIEEHLSYSTQQNEFLLLRKRGKGLNPTRKLCLINHDMQVIEYHNAPPSVLSHFVVGSCNGLLCLCCHEFESFILWNPATREILHVPQVDLQVEPQYIESCLVGFGFSPISNDYKMVRLVFTSTGTVSFTREDSDSDLKVSLVQVFSLSTGSWKEVVEVGETKVINVTPHAHMGFTFDGAIFWFGRRFKPGLRRNVEFCLISFDIATESLTLIPIPRHVSGFIGFTVFDDKLAMLCNRAMYRSSSESNKPYSINSQLINLWVMKKCIDALGERWIWTNMYAHVHTHSACFSSLLTIWRNQLFWKPYESGSVDEVEKTLVLCNLHTNELKMLAIGKYPIVTGVWRYAESLVSLGSIHIEASSS